MQINRFFLTLAICVNQGAAFASNGFFNGPVDSGEVISTELAREALLSDFVDSYKTCAAESFKEVYRQVYPQFKGELAVVLGGGKTSPIRFDPEDTYYYSKNDVRYVYGLQFIGPRDINGDYENVPPQLVFAFNGDFYGRGLTGKYEPAPDRLQSVTVKRFETNSDVNLKASFPAFRFNTEKRNDGYDELGNAINERYVVTGIRVIRPVDFGAKVPFINFETGADTRVRWNQEAYVDCLVSDLARLR
ncbi:MAG TPA: hypothetical protein VE954_22475 [Oligoflexus sp.]|uniref:hypothetical protein n=1 Tax=Oligoflexus sp. TaxID=1971216 RepID=UPI002D52C21E|nr:hypothetical protein [Oligoflexus sp.]HYX35875.1 hypothetical protein [Oligoflexus sp.]